MGRMTEMVAPIEQVYREQSARIWRALLLYSSDPEIASDATAEAFAQLLGRGPGVRDPPAWVGRTAFKIAGGSLAKKGRAAGPGGGWSEAWTSKTRCRAGEAKGAKCARGASAQSRTTNPVLGVSERSPAMIAAAPRKKENGETIIRA